MAKRRLKRRIRRFLFRLRALLFLLFFVFAIYFFLKLLFVKNYIDSIEYNNGYINITLTEDMECILSSNSPTLNDKWIQSENKICSLKIDDYKTNIFLKKDEKIIKNKDTYFEIKENEKVYLSNNEEYNYFYYIIGKQNKISISIEDTNIASLDEEYIIHTKKLGKTKITFKYDDYYYESELIVTDLLGNRDDYKNKEKLTCEKFTIEEEKILDDILKQNINNVGFKTRAGVVEAARFLALDFPYRINYFYENGRQTTNNVDGEGRYYHVGLYLTEKKIENLTGSTYTSNKAPWGCKIFSYPINKKDENGLDCSGFVSWALLNGGFDVKDVGAGWSDKEDLTDFGDVLKLNETNSSSEEIKVGDLLHSERLGGHIAIIIGKDDTYYYVAQAIWYDEVGLVVSKIKKNELYKEFPHAVLMEDYYKNDGNLTNMW